RGRARAGGAAPAARPATRDDRARLLRRVHAVGAGRPARPAPRHHQEQDVRGPHTPAGAALGRRDGVERESVHELTAAYALDALDPHDEREYEEHLRACERCRSELSSFRGTTASLAYAVAAPPPPPALRARIMEPARAERSNVVPQRRRWVVPTLGAAAAVAAAVAIGLGIWAASLHSDLSGTRN